MKLKLSLMIIKKLYYGQPIKNKIIKKLKKYYCAVIAFQGTSKEVL